MTIQVDWYYHRSGCKTCSRMDEFLEEQGVQVRETANAKQQKLGKSDALNLGRQMRRIVATRGKSVVTLDRDRDDISDADITRHLVGPTGNLRAPTLRRGETLLVGFNSDAFAEELS